MVVDNLTRQSAIGSIFESCNFENSYLLDSALGYESGYVEDDNITWCLYSIFDNFNCPNIDLARKENPDKFNKLEHTNFYKYNLLSIYDKSSSNRSGS